MFYTACCLSLRQQGSRANLHRVHGNGRLTPLFTCTICNECTTMLTASHAKLQLDAGGSACCAWFVGDATKEASQLTVCYCSLCALGRWH